MDIQHFDSIEKINRLWQELYDNNEDLSWFQSYNWNLLLEKNFKSLAWTEYLLTKIHYVVIDNKIIFPIELKHAKKKLCFLGQSTCSDYLSAIYSKELTVTELKSYIIRFCDIYKGYHIILDRINQANRLREALMEISQDGLWKIKEKDCVCVPIITDKSNSFYDSLSKSARQNYRTAKNRLLKDGHQYYIECSYGVVGKERTQLLESIYKNRTREYETAAFRTLFTRSIRKLLKFFRIESKQDLVSVYSGQHDVLYGIIYIDNIIAAFFIGNFNNNKKSASIVRVSTNMDFYKYSPGQILLVESIESLRSHLDFFDLTRGTESYKMKLGGIIHHNYCYELSNP